MKSLQALALSLLVALGVHVVMTWPLVGSLTEGIPSSAHDIEKDHTRAMIHGDHLQLLYFFWLGGDMVLGKTPAFQDIYQFNTGSDADREQVRTYFAPFSFFYLAGQLLNGRALGINLAGFMATWLILFFTWGLCRRYTSNPWVALAAALAGTTTSYRWAALMNGSPMGYALTWIPAIFWGLDCAIRDRSWNGALLAGLAFLCLASGDVQAFFFGALAAPAFCAFSWFFDPNREPVRIQPLLQLGLRLLPAVLLAALGFLYIRSLTAGVSQSGFKDGRSLAEVALYSPMLEGLWSHARLGASNDIYLGFVIPGLLLGGLAVLILQLLKRKPFTMQESLLFLSTFVAVGIIILLALGTNSPFEALALRGIRKLIPPYEMIRQSGKIYSLMPTAVSLCLVFASTLLLRGVHSAGIRRMLIGLAALFILIDAKSQVQATICLLDKEQPAYAAVARDAEDRQVKAHAMAVPLWPGADAHSSLYQHYATLYRIRMLNGYHPVIPYRYEEDIFQGFSSVNRGYLDDEQLDALRTRGIEYIILHENAFPEKVSPFTAGQTLEALLRHPRIQVLAQGGPVWSFRIEAAPSETAVHPGSVTGGWHFPARRWEAEHAGRPIGVNRQDPEAYQGGYAALSSTKDALVFRSTTLSPKDGQQVLLRVRGSGRLRATTVLDKGPSIIHELPVNSPSWMWLAAPVDIQVTARTTLKLELISGKVDIDTLSLTAGKGAPPPQTKQIFFPASAFFRAGYTQLESQSVVLRKKYEPDNPLFYGPYLPLSPGHYQVSLQFSSDAPEGTSLGLFSLQADESFRSVFVTAGQSAQATWTQKESLPLRFEFQYSREADMVIEGLLITRLQ